MAFRGSPGARAQIGGAIATLVGVLLRVFGPGPVSGVPIDPHQYADVIIGMGICLLAGGTLARLFTRG